ncbi:Aste57867_23416 [Aphanomyces stellatus]|uniref:Aste57867_23416 protein n=1 Tax=Aphanomyces stellatus TaxID=120398 RepID=A0A485LMP7_9STRA|nr:hypothetical protein As57867_023345 [Aphanomyces stellatus]VFU00062.1 Aste57867_23416 [Aphanomyces stellatus]
MAEPAKDAWSVEPIPDGGGSTHTANGVAQGAWRATLCGCFDSILPNCLMVSFCHCFALAQVSHRIGSMPYPKTLAISGSLIVTSYVVSIIGNQVVASCTAQMASIQLQALSPPPNVNYASWLKGLADQYKSYETQAQTANSICSAVALITGIAAVVLICHVRTKVRLFFRIPGSVGNDCILSLCCSCCTIAQMATQTQSYTDGSCRFGPPDVLPAYNDQAAAP